MAGILVLSRALPCWRGYRQNRENALVNAAELVLRPRASAGGRRPPCSWLHRNQSRADGGRRFAQVAVEGGQRQAGALRQVQIHAIVGRQPILLGQPENGRPFRRHNGRSDANRKRRQILQELAHLRFCHPAATLRDLKAVNDFERPVRWNEDVFAGFNTIEQRFGPGRRLVCKSPGQRRGSVDDESHQYLWPSWMRSLIFKPPRITPLRDSRMWATASAGVFLRSAGCCPARVSRARSRISS